MATNAMETTGTGDHELPMLAGIGTALRWLEELVTLISGPLLTMGLAIALIDLLTDGRLLASQPGLLYAWAISQAVGVDGQLVGAAVKAGRAARSGRPWQSLAYGALILALGYVAYLASNVFATQQALGISTQAALSRLGMDDTRWIVARSLLAVILVVLSGVLRYSPAKAAVETAELRAEREARELAEARHKAELRAVKVAGFHQAKEAAFGRLNPLQSDAANPVESGEESTGNDSEPTTGNDTPSGQTASGAKQGGMRVPAGMMTSPDFRRHLAREGVIITPEQAVAHVRGIRGSRRIGTTYAAPKGPLMRIANNLIEAAQSTGNEREEAQEMGA